MHRNAAVKEYEIDKNWEIWCDWSQQIKHRQNSADAELTSRSPPPAPECSLGGDDQSWAYDGSTEEKIYGGLRESYGKKWAVGDIVGVFLDTNDKTIVFSLNGELLVDPIIDSSFLERWGRAA